VHFSLLVIQKAHSEQHDMEHSTRLKHAYSIFRGILRALKDGLEEKVEFIEEALRKIMCMENFARATIGQFLFDSSMSHRLIKVERIDNERKKTRTELLSDYVSRGFERIVPFEKRDSLKPWCSISLIPMLAARVSLCVLVIPARDASEGESKGIRSTQILLLKV
jgi:hypothetical protein